MPIDIQTIAGYLESHSLKFQMRQSETGEFIHTVFSTQRYENTQGDKHLHLYIVLEENGEFFRVVSPNCYELPEESFQRAFYKTLLMISSKSKMVQFSCDSPSPMDVMNATGEVESAVIVSADGEMEWITATVEIPIEDGDLTETQMLRAFFALIKILEYYHPVIHNVMETGDIDFEIVEQAGFIMSLMNQLMEIDGIEEDSEEFESTEGDSSQSDEDSESSSDDFGDFI